MLDHQQKIRPCLVLLLSRKELRRWHQAGGKTKPEGTIHSDRLPFSLPFDYLISLLSRYSGDLQKTVNIGLSRTSSTENSPMSNEMIQFYRVCQLLPPPRGNGQSASTNNLAADGKPRSPQIHVHIR